MIMIFSSISEIMFVKSTAVRIEMFNFYATCFICYAIVTKHVVKIVNFYNDKQFFFDIVYFVKTLSLLVTIGSMRIEDTLTIPP